MSFKEQYLELKKQKKAARRNMQEKRDAIVVTVFESVTDKQGMNVCIKHIPVVGIGVGGNPAEIEIDHCEFFSNSEYCPNLNCGMCRKNHEFINSVKVYKSIKSAQRKLVKDALHLRKH